MSEVNLKLAGKFRLMVRDGVTNEIKTDTGWFDNLITNNGLNFLATNSGSSFISYCSLGSNNTPPVGTDVGVLTPISTGGNAATTGYTRTRVDVNSNLTYWSTTCRYNFSAGAVVGTVREIAVTNHPSNNTSAFSRALLKAGGIPAEVVVTATDLVSVDYELRCYVNTSDVVTNVTISGTPYTVTVRPIYLNDNKPWTAQGGAFSMVSGLDYVLSVNSAGLASGSNSVVATATSLTITKQAYVLNSFETVINCSISNGTAMDIAGIFMRSEGCLQGKWAIVFTPSITKSVNQKLNFVVKYKWGRYVP